MVRTCLNTEFQPTSSFTHSNLTLPHLTRAARAGGALMSTLPLLEVRDLALYDTLATGLAGVQP